jgi:tRNA threonylcarbamoyl adenosine modification protein YeaZ
MLLAFDTSSAACTAALFDGDGRCIAQRDELIGRGHAEQLVPMIADLMAGRSATSILVGVGPGSFTGIRVAIAAAYGLAIGWSAEIRGMSSLALLAAGASHQGNVAAAVTGGHGELFVQEFGAGPPAGIRNLPPAEAARFVTASLVIGSGARQLVEERGWGEARDDWPSARNALKIPAQLRSLAAKPIYARAPDARIPEAA